MDALIFWLAVVDDDGRWQPGIGDPSVMGWVTVAAYLFAAMMCLAYAWRASGAGGVGHRILWIGIAAVMLVLGINKQLDLQSLLTQIGRDLSHSQGWYESRRAVQRSFIIVVATAGVAALVATFALSRRRWRRNWPALAGLTLLGTFVVIRAASFHHMDALIDHRIAVFRGIRINWVLELVGIAIVAVAACVNLWSEPRAARNASAPQRGDPLPQDTDPAPHASAASDQSTH